MKKYCWIYFKGGYGLMDVECTFLDHQKGLYYVADYLIKIDPDRYKDMPLDELYMEANADLHEFEVIE